MLHSFGRFSRRATKANIRLLRVESYMSKIYEIDYLNGITRIRLLDRPTFDDLKVIIDEIAENYPYEKRLWDLSNIDFHFTISELHDIAEYGKKKFIKPNNMAIISPDINVDVEMAIFEVYRKQAGNSYTRAFRNERKAIEWLNNL